MLIWCSVMKIIDELKALGVTVDEQADELIVISNASGILFEMIVDELNDENLREEILKEVKHHLESIESEDKDYFDGCNAEYLKGEWKQLLLSIYNVVYSVCETEVNQEN